MLLDYFGQELGKDNCGACDVCLGELDLVEDSLVIAQKILSCVVRLKERFGAEYTTDVLLGSKGERILRNGHDRLSTYGLLADQRKRTVRDWLEQLVGQDCLRKSGEYSVLSVTEKGWRVLRGQETPRLVKPAERRRSAAALRDWEASTGTCSKRCENSAARSPWRRTCPRTSCSATPRFATWPGGGRRRRLPSSAFTASDK